MSCWNLRAGQGHHVLVDGDHAGPFDAFGGYGSHIIADHQHSGLNPRRCPARCWVLCCVLTSSAASTMSSCASVPPRPPGGRYHWPRSCRERSRLGRLARLGIGGAHRPTSRRRRRCAGCHDEVCYCAEPSEARQRSLHCSTVGMFATVHLYHAAIQLGHNQSGALNSEGVPKLLLPRTNSSAALQQTEPTSPMLAEAIYAGRIGAARRRDETRLRVAVRARAVRHPSGHPHVQWRFRPPPGDAVADVADLPGDLIGIRRVCGRSPCTRSGTADSPGCRRTRR